MRRYEEELDLLEWVAQSASLPRDFKAIEHTIVSEFAARLARGDRNGAETLRRFADEHLPQAHLARALMRISSPGRVVAGYALKLVEALYMRFTRQRV